MVFLKEIRLCKSDITTSLLYNRFLALICSFRGFFIHHSRGGLLDSWICGQEDKVHDLFKPANIKTKATPTSIKNAQAVKKNAHKHLQYVSQNWITFSNEELLHAKLAFLQSRSTYRVFRRRHEASKCMEIDSEIYKVSTNSSYLKIMRELSSSKQSSILELRVDGETCKGEYVSDGFYMSILTLKSPGCENSCVSCSAIETDLSSI